MLSAAALKPEEDVAAGGGGGGGGGGGCASSRLGVIVAPVSMPIKKTGEGQGHIAYS